MGEPDNPDQKNQANMARHCRQNLGIYSVSSDTLQSQKCYLENLFNIDVPIIFFHYMHIFLIIWV